MYTRGRFDQELYIYSDRQLRDAESIRLRDIARRGKPDAATSLLLRIRAQIAALLIRAGVRLQPKQKPLPQPTLPSRPLTG